MTGLQNIKNKLKQNELDEKLLKVYTKESLEAQKKRHLDVIDTFADLYGENDNVHMFSAPGRTEVGGNHTDHNNGKVLAASINLDTIAMAAKRDDNIICEKSLGHSMNKLDVTDLEVKPDEFGKSISLIRGMCAGFKEYGYKIGGFNSTGATQVLSGSGLSSSAAFEVLIGTILNHLYNGGEVPSVDIAKIAQFAENKYFNKPSGLMDQTACSVGGFISIDFKDTANPEITKIDFDFDAVHHSLCIVDTKGSHAGLTDEYAAVRGDMEAAAAVFGKNVLREVDENELYSNISKVRSSAGDRAVLRATHFYNENHRVDRLKKALRENDFEAFKATITQSGHSSYMFNQNVFSVKNPNSQPVSLALSICERTLEGSGAWRVHGGGFAGTIQAFVPDEKLEEFKTAMQAVFGEDSCYILKIRNFGGIQLY